MWTLETLAVNVLFVWALTLSRRWIDIIFDKLIDNFRLHW